MLKQDGSVVKAGNDDIQDLSAPVEHEAPVYTDYRQKHVTVPGLRPGEVLEYDLVTTVHTALAPGQFWTEYEFDKNDIVLDEELDLDVPSGRPLELKSKQGMDPKITDANGRRVYHWTSSHLVREDERKDKDKEKAKQEAKEGSDDEHPDIQLTTFSPGRRSDGGTRTWKKTAARRRPKFAPRRKNSPRASPPISTKWRRSTITWLRISATSVCRWEWAATSRTPQATCCTISTATAKTNTRCWRRCSKPRACTPSSVLINSSRKLDPDIPSPSQFDHVITMLPRRAGRIWMDTTSEVAPFRLLAYTLRHKQALVIPADGSAASGRDSRRHADARH